MRRNLFGLAVVIGLAIGLQAATLAQAAAPQSAKVANPYADATLGISFYKIAPGKQDEWLALFNNYHRKVMQYSIDQGSTLSMTVYKPQGHKRNGWDFAIAWFWPKNRKPNPLAGEALIKSLFPNPQEYIDAERQRWAITEEHWDESFNQIDMDRTPLTIMIP